MTDYDRIQEQLPAYLDRRAPDPPHGLLDDLLRQAGAVPQRRRILAFTPMAVWAAAGIGAAVLVVLVLTIWRGGLVGHRSVPGGDISPVPSAVPSVTTIVVPVAVGEKAIAGQAADIMGERLRALGIGNFTSSVGDDMQFQFILPPSVSRADVDAVLKTVGRVEWVVWPQGLGQPVQGAAVPDGALPLFDAASQIISAKPITADGQHAVEIRLGPRATQSLSDYTAAHIGEPLPLAMDGTVLTAPTIQGVISAGDLLITFPDAPGPGMSEYALAAILGSGPLPAGWTTD